MPRDALSHLGGTRPDIVLGNRHGLSAAARVTDAVAHALETQGWQVRRNSPFAGAYIATAYGRPAKNVHVVQVEIDRSLYMDEATITPLDCFGELCERMGRAVAGMAQLGAAPDAEQPMAAE